MGTEGATLENQGATLGTQGATLGTHGTTIRSQGAILVTWGMILAEAALGIARPQSHEGGEAPFYKQYFVWFMDQRVPSNIKKEKLKVSLGPRWLFWGRSPRKLIWGGFWVGGVGLTYPQSLCMQIFYYLT